MKITKKYSFDLLMLCYVAFAYLWMDGYYSIERFKGIGVNVQGNFGFAEYVRQAVFIFEYILAIYVLFLSSKVKGATGAVFLALAWVFVTIDLVTHKIYGRPADLSNISVLNASVSNLYDAIQQYSSLIVESLASSAVLFIPLLLVRFILKGKLSFKPLLIPFVVLILIYVFIMIKRGAPALIGFPKGFSYAFATISLKINDFTFTPKRIHTIQYARGAQLPVEINTIVVVIDESIEFSEFNKQLANGNNTVINYGRSYSGGNCSAPSNYILRKGFWESSSGEFLNIAEVDSLFEIAKRNGYLTTYIDNQGVLKDPTTRNYISNDELKFIDKIIENDGAQFDRDPGTIGQVLDISAHGKNFILVNKNGAHFPYENTLDPSMVTANNHENYARSIKHNSIDFVSAIAARIPENAVIFYTSDHGQELNAKGTHCNTGDSISPKEYAVPFLIITRNNNLLKILHEKRMSFQDSLTHLEFSESVRNALGERVPNANSVFNFMHPQLPYCGLYGQPISFFGVLPSCVKVNELVK